MSFIPDLLVGNTGFVGGNLMAAHSFAASCHSSDVSDYFSSSPGLCVYAGVPAAMFLANSAPEKDLGIMREARGNIRRIQPRELVLISTIAVYADSRGKTEDGAVSAPSMPAYGYNRLLLEQWVREDFPHALIIRLPALYGRGLKKNFLYDMLTIAPAMLRADKYEELAARSELVRRGYSLAENGFYKMNGRADGGQLRRFFERNDFNALSFTDSRSRYQFYNLGRLWQDIARAREAGLTTLNLATPPVSAAEVYEHVTGRRGWRNELGKPPFDYDLRSRYADLMGGARGYLCSKSEELQDINRFMRGARP